jgi:hypothetical protein
VCCCKLLECNAAILGDLLMLVDQSRLFAKSVHICSRLRGVQDRFWQPVSYLQGKEGGVWLAL